MLLNNALVHKLNVLQINYTQWEDNVVHQQVHVMLVHNVLVYRKHVSHHEVEQDNRAMTMILVLQMTHVLQKVFVVANSLVNVKQMNNVMMATLVHWINVLVVRVVMNQRQPLFNVVLHAPLVVMWLIIALALLLNVEWIELQVILHYVVQLLVLVILQNIVMELMQNVHWINLRHRLLFVDRQQLNAMLKRIAVAMRQRVRPTQCFR
mmetsp:Transcript_22711/g.38542  ORF Transcript_22711/g.38542 Transcript_22711/m.38542 type:complete len:208 (+) Transcript_22711:703-1326(+)